MVFENPLLKRTQEQKLELVRANLPELAGASDDAFLALAGHFEEIPQRFFDRAVYAEYSSWLSTQLSSPLMLQLLRDQRARLDRAFRSLAEINDQAWHDELLGSDADQLRFVDRHAHPAYLRLVEGVLNSFLLLPAWVSRVQRGKPTEGLDVFNVVEEVKKALPLSTAHYNHQVRNGIAHGGVDYFDDKIVYTSKGQSTELYRQALVPLVDNLVDSCNALALALKVFLLTSGFPRADWPQEVLLQELQAAAATPWWQIVACLASRSAKGSQLNIHVVVNTSDYDKAFFSSVHTAAVAHYLAPGYDRYFLSFRSEIALPGWAGFDGKKLADISQRQGADLAAYAAAIEDNLIFYVPDRKLPSVLGSADNLRLALQLGARGAVDRFRAERGRCIIDVRLVERHKDPLLVSNAWAVVRKPSVSLIRSDVRGLLSQMHSSERGLLNLLPEGFSYMSLFAHDHRRRRLRSFGLGADLICTVARSRDPRKSRVDIFGSRVEIVHGVRIAWNTNWPGLGDHLASGPAATTDGAG